jgi:hypothetical protein
VKAAHHQAASLNNDQEVRSPRRWKSVRSHPLFFLFLMLAAALVSYAIVPRYPVFHAGDDYLIYTYFAEAASEHVNPYAVPPEYRSTTLPHLFEVGGTQTAPGIVQQQYADYPPLLMAVNAALFRVNHLRGIYWLSLGLYLLAIILFGLYAAAQRSANLSKEVTSLCFLIFFTLNPLIASAWFKPAGDKTWFAFFVMALLVARNKPYWVAGILGVFAAVKGLGIPVLFMYCIYLAVTRTVTVRQGLVIVGIVGCVLVGSHLPWFPEWIQAYRWRALRQSVVGHESLFLPLVTRDGYWSGMPIVLTAGAFLVLMWLTLKRLTTLPEVLLLPIVASIIFNTDVSFDRLLVAIVVMLLLIDRNGVLFLSYVIGIVILLLPHESIYAWQIVWLWMALLIFVTGKRFAGRYRARLTAHP